MALVAQNLELEAALRKAAPSLELLQEGYIKFVDAAKVIISIWDETGNLQPRTLRAKVVKYIDNLIECQRCEHMCGEQPKHSNGNAFRWILLPQLLMAFCQRYVSEADVEQCVRTLVEASKQSSQSKHSSQAMLRFDAESHGRYVALGEGDKCGVLVQRDSRIQELVKALEIARRRESRANAKIVAVTNANTALRMQLKSVLKQVRFRKGFNCHVTPFSGYTLAIRRNCGHSSAAVTCAMVACGELGGNVTDRRTVWVYEHRLACAKRVRSSAMYQSCFNNTSDICEVHRIASDATHHEAVQRKKVHMSLITSVCAPHAALNTSPIDVAYATTVVNTAGDLQPVEAGNVDETYMHLLREFDSVGCPTWLGRVADAAANPNRMSTYIIGGDGGSENPGCFRRVAASVKATPNVSVTLMVCMFHSVHLIVAAMLKVFDTLEGNLAHAKPYFSSLATIVNVMRSTGVPTKIRQVVADLFPTCAGFRQLPGRCLRGRWGSVDSAETYIRNVAHEIGDVFKTVFEPKISAAAKQRKKRAPGHDEEAPIV